MKYHSIAPVYPKVHFQINLVLVLDNLCQYCELVLLLIACICVGTVCLFFQDTQGHVSNSATPPPSYDEAMNSSTPRKKSQHEITSASNVEYINQQFKGIDLQRDNRPDSPSSVSSSKRSGRSSVRGRGASRGNEVCLSIHHTALLSNKLVVYVSCCKAMLPSLYGSLSSMAVAGEVELCFSLYKAHQLFRGFLRADIIFLN